MHAEEGEGSALDDAPSAGSSAGGGGARAGGADILLDVEREGIAAKLKNEEEPCVWDDEDSRGG